jgi:hypothetical protein
MGPRIHVPVQDRERDDVSVGPPKDDEQISGPFSGDGVRG